MDRILVCFLFLFVSLAGHSRAADLSASRRTAIVEAVEAVRPATVTIGAKRLAVQQVNPFRSMYDDFFSDWFADPFFGGFRRVVRVQSLGSGILVSRAGLILTNDHVVAGAEEIMVTLSDGRIFPAHLKGRGLPLDLALLEIDQPKQSPADLPYVTLGTSGDLALGEWAIAIGAPKNLEASVTAGIISAVGRRLPTKQDYRYLGMIQTDAAINPGNSGGPLVNADGKVVGINTVIISESGGSEGLGFAIPADQVRKVLDDLVSAGEVRFAWFGWELEEDKSEEGLVVKQVYPSTPASNAGVPRGAILRTLNGNPVRTKEDYEGMLLTTRVGQNVAARISEDGRDRVVRLTAEIIPESYLRVDLGLEVQDVSARYRQIAGGGVLVTAVRSKGFFGQLDPSPVQPGDIIVALAGRRIETVESYESIVRQLKKGVKAEFAIRRQNVLLRFSVQL